MFKFYYKFLAGLLFVFATMGAKAQVDVTASGGTPAASYGTLKGAFDAINAGTHTGIITIGISGNTTETVSAVLNASGAGAASYTTIGITPTGGAARTITGAISGILIDLNGADNVTIDGLNSGGNALAISNTTAAGAASTIRFIADATTNTITNCTISGSTTGLGTVSFSTGTISGNIGNTISNNSIGAAGASLPLNGIYSLGTSLAIPNTVNVTGNSIFDFFSAGSSSSGININSSNTAWTVTNNSFYQTAIRTSTASNQHNGIFISNTGIGYSITGNYIGGGAAACGGGAWQLLGAFTNRFVGISVAAGSTATTSIQGNTIANFSTNSNSAAATVNGNFCGISVTSGNANIGTLTGNTIGSGIGNGSITVNLQTNTGGAANMISYTGAGLVDVRNNTIGSINLTGATTAIGESFNGILINGGTLNIVNNTIGSTTTTNSINSSTIVTGITAVQTVIGISVNTGVTSATATISGNTIANLTQAGTTSGVNCGVKGIQFFGTGTAPTISNNTIRGLSAATANATVSLNAGIIGIISGPQTTSAASTITGNTIYTLKATNTGAVQSNVFGILITNSTTSTIQKNKIYDLQNASTMTVVTTPPMAVGIGSRATSVSTTLSNNFISLGSAQTSNTEFIGILQGSTTTGNVNVYNNSVSISGTVTTGALPSFGFLRADNSTVAITTPVDVRNNIFDNKRTGGTGKHYAISNNYGVTTASATGWGSGASDYNVLNSATSTTIGLWTSDRDFTTWKSASASDANSKSGITVTFADVPNGDLHLSMGATPTQIESGGVSIAAVPDDIDNQARPGPVGPVNGGGTAYDIGADEFDGAPLDLTPPLISYTALNFTCNGAINRTLTATISDASGVPQSGAGLPVLYWKINAGAYTAATGSWVSGNTYTFSFGAGASVGDVVSYYIVAQDNAAIPNAGAFPSAGAAGFSINPPAASTPPTTPSSYNISITLSGNYNVGVGQAYTTLTAAISAYNNGCLSGPVTFTLTDALYSASETFPIVVTANPNASSTNTLTILPAAGITPSISGSSTVAILKLNGADYVTIDGSNSGTTSRDLTIANTNTGTTQVILWLGSASATDGATNNVIKNCILTGNAPTTTFSGIVSSSGTTIGNVAEAANTGNLYTNNKITAVYYGLALVGPTGNESGTVISGNSIGSTIAASKIGFKGIFLAQQNGVLVTGNIVSGLTTSISSSITGIYIAGTQSGGVISNNTISDVKNTNSGGYGSNGIGLYSTSTSGNVTVQNNMIYDVASVGFASSVGENDNGYGIMVNTGGGYNIHFNTVSLNTNQTGTGVTAAINIAAAATALNITNNIFSSTQTTGTRYGIYTSGTAAAFTNINYNDYSAQNVGFLTSAKATLANWQSATSQDARSLAVAPVFTSTTDLHLTAANCSLDGRGNPVAGITTDFDNTTRDAGAPDMGADEYSATLGTTLAVPSGAGTATTTYNVSPLGTTFSNGACEIIAKVLPSGGGTAVTGSIKATVTVDASVQTYLLEPYAQRHYDLEPATSASTATATVTLYFTDAEFVAFNAAASGYNKLPTVAGGGSADPLVTNVRIRQYHGTGTVPGTYSGATLIIDPVDADVQYTGTRWEVQIPVNGFSGFYLVTNPVVTPLGVTYFRGVKQGNINSLTWKVNCATSPRATMTLERSADGRNFAPINSITADAVRCLSEFTYDDANPLTGVNYYRLKSVDADGRTTYSSIVTLLNKVKGFELVNIAPNPSNGQFKLNITTTEKTSMVVIIADMQGRVVNQSTVSLINGFNAVDMNVNKLASGTYQVYGTTTEGRTRTISLVKQ